MDKEKLRQRLGEFGDVSDKLAQIFGDAYLDAPDDTFTEDLKLKGFEVREASGLIGRIIESVEKITCQRNQEILGAHLEFIESKGAKGRRMDMEEGWQTVIHSTSCSTSLCWDLHVESCLEGR